MIAALVVTAAAIGLAYTILRPTPPHTVAMATDPEGSITAELGQRYREILAHDGIEVELVPSAGAVENVARLRNPESAISIAIIPGGITNHQESPGLVSLGTLFYEPLWFFYHGALRQKNHESLRGLRISIGPEGSGTNMSVTRIPCAQRDHRPSQRPTPAALAAGRGREIAPG